MIDSILTFFNHPEVKIIILMVLHSVHAFYEVFIDSTLAELFKYDGRSEIENDMMHSYQMPYRVAILFFSVAWLFGITWLGLAVFVFISDWFWINFDVLSARSWLDKKWWYVGKTPFIDSRLPSWANWTIKGVIFAGSIYWIAYLT